MKAGSPYVRVPPPNCIRTGERVSPVSGKAVPPFNFTVEKRGLRKLSESPVVKKVSLRVVNYPKKTPAGPLDNEEKWSGVGG